MIVFTKSAQDQWIKGQLWKQLEREKLNDEKSWVITQAAVYI